MASAQRNQSSDGQTRLIKHFQDHEIGDHAAGWSNLWDTDSSDLWDRGKPSPALIDLIEQRRDLFHPDKGDGKRKRALVPGCGRGYDAVMLALHGFDVYGLDVSEKGVISAREYAETELAKPQAYNFGSACRPAEQTGQEKGQVTFIQGDFFKSDWEVGIQFDLIYDYTFLCALHPSMRPSWASRMADLLSTTGMLVCLEFPLYKDPTLPGPPWGLNGVYWNLLVEGGTGIVSENGDSVGDGRGEGRFHRLLHTKPARSYENGRGTDMLGVYVKK
ncbi:hypothetical protein BDW75DRAFT_222541 [Aspergillus navahoensis]